MTGCQIWCSMHSPVGTMSNGINRRHIEYKFNPLSRDRYLGCLRAGMRRGEAARAAGVSRQTIYHAQQRDEQFAADCLQAEADGCEVVESYLLEACKDLDVSAIKFYLTNRNPGRWSNGPKNTTIINVNPQTPQDDLKAIEEDLMKKLTNLEKDNNERPTG